MTGNVRLVTGSREGNGSWEAGRCSLCAKTGSTTPTRLDLFSRSFLQSRWRRFNAEKLNKHEHNPSSWREQPQSQTFPFRWPLSCWRTHLETCFPLWEDGKVASIFTSPCCGGGENNRLCKSARLTPAPRPPSEAKHSNPNRRQITPASDDCSERVNRRISNKNRIFSLGFLSSRGRQCAQSRHCLTNWFCQLLQTVCIQPEEATRGQKAPREALKSKILL